MQLTAQQRRQKRAARMRHHLKRVAAIATTQKFHTTGEILPQRARLAVFKSNSHMYAQIIDDTAGKTLVSASTIDKTLAKNITKSASMDAAKTVGKAIGERAAKAGVKDVYFDRGGNAYTGRIQALAEAAREAGLNF